MKTPLEISEAEARDMFAHESYEPLDRAAAIREYVAARRLGFDRATARMLAESMIEDEVRS